MTLIAKVKYEICYPNPLTLVEGDLVDIIKSEPQNSEWFGWHFCKNSSGKEGWVSEDFIEINHPVAKAIKEYSARELDAKVGDVFEVLEESCGWLWCRNNVGHYGWLPKNIF